MISQEALCGQTKRKPKPPDADTQTDFLQIDIPDPTQHGAHQQSRRSPNPTHRRRTLPIPALDRARTLHCPRSLINHDRKGPLHDASSSRAQLPPQSLDNSDQPSQRLTILLLGRIFRKKDDVTSGVPDRQHQQPANQHRGIGRRVDANSRFEVPACAEEVGRQEVVGGEVDRELVDAADEQRGEGARGVRGVTALRGRAQEFQREVDGGEFDGGVRAQSREEGRMRGLVSVQVVEDGGESERVEGGCLFGWWTRQYGKRTER